MIYIIPLSRQINWLTWIDLCVQEQDKKWHQQEHKNNNPSEGEELYL